MNSLLSLFSKVEFLQNVTIIEIFPSKKHTVALIKKKEKHFVLKKYNPGFQEAFLQEYKVLRERNTPFLKPELLQMNNDFHFLLLNYIPNENVCDLINDPKRLIQDKLDTITNLATWFYQFHKYFQQQSTPLLHGDANLRNFIISQNKKMYGLDFEDSKPGDVNEDIAFLSASILTTTPTFTKEKKQLQHQFITTYEKLSNQKINNVKSLIRQSVEKTIERRKNKN